MSKSESKLLVIGAGLPRTGTLSLSKALEILLDGKCYHMQPFLEKGTDYDIKHWNDALAANKKHESLPKERWTGLLEDRGYNAGVDFPVSFYYEDLIRYFPEAKVVLTVRTPQTWHDSVKNSIMRILKVVRSFPFSWIMTIKGQAKKHQVQIDYNSLRAVKWKFRVAHVISEAAPNGFEYGVFSSVAAGPEKSAQFFEKWTEQVKATVPPERLLIFEAKQGWGPLCEFLGVPVPDTPYPRVNDTASMGNRVTQLERTAWFLTFAVPSVLAGFLYFFKNPILSLLKC